MKKSRRRLLPFASVLAGAAACVTSADIAKRPAGGDDAGPVNADATVDASVDAVLAVDVDAVVDAHDGAQEGAQDGGLGTPCQREADCAAGFTCGYSLSEGCSAKGVCVPNHPSGGTCCALLDFCTCAGARTTSGCNYYSAGGVQYAAAPASGQGCLYDASTIDDAGCTPWGSDCNSLPCCAGLHCSPIVSGQFICAHWGGQCVP